MFRAEVRGCPDRHSSLRNSLPARGADCFGDAEVENERLALEKNDVLGFDVAVNDALPVCEVQRSSDLTRDSQYFAQGKSLSIHAPAERLTLDEWHDVVQRTVRLTGVMNRDDVGVGQSGDGLNFLEKPLGAECCGDIRVKNLDGDASAMPWVERAIDCGHPAAANLVLYGIPVTEVVHARSIRRMMRDLGKSGKRLSQRVGVSLIIPLGCPKLAVPFPGVTEHTASFAVRTAAVTAI